ncbi:hypothetical protein DFH06DRAFT_1239531, partial [Mycena polygramma]
MTHKDDESLSETGGRISAIDEELEGLETRIAALKAERNSIVPISTLPPELLCHIFSVYIRSLPPSSMPPWPKVILVCRRWRDVVLGTSMLWGHLNFLWRVDEKTFLRQLERSGTSPLTIRIGHLASQSHADAILTN